ncbi:hypothetical protein LguiB_015848 [Lonicera macranthoides]
MPWVLTLGSKSGQYMESKADKGGDLVVLRCIEPTTPHQMEANHQEEEILISTADANHWDLSAILTHHQIVKVIVDRNRQQSPYLLIEHSSYFYGLLSGNFSESHLQSISIKWNLETFLSILKFMCGCPLAVTSDNFLPLFEVFVTHGALFFGVDMLLLKCKIWLSEVTSDSGIRSLQLEDLIRIWKFGLDHVECAAVNDFIPELCTSCLAKNFMWAMSCNSFGNIPYDLLFSCLKHPYLTVHSEKHFSDALLAWLAVNSEQSANDNCSDILKQIRISLLPLWFAAGKRNCRNFSKFADESINAILTLVQHPSTSSMNVLGDGDLCHLRIRLTEYTERFAGHIGLPSLVIDLILGGCCFAFTHNMDISGCPQMKLAILLLSILPSSYSMDPMLRKSVKQSPVNFERFDEDKFQISLGLWPIMSFKAVQEVNISNCPMLHLEAAIECFCKSFPSIRTLKAAYFLNFRTTKLCWLVQKCPLLCNIDLTVDTSPLIPTRVSILSSSQARTRLSVLPFNIYNFPSVTTLSSMPRPLQLHITRLTLEGRTDISDSDLQNISELCVSLCDLNLKACTSVTDAGIAALILKCVKLHSIVVCDTSFGQSSVRALCSTIGDFVGAPQNQGSLAYKLQTLHMGGCKGADATSVSELMSQTPLLKSLCLRETELVDSGLYSFFGSSLEKLDISYTKVSAAALACIVSRNPGLKQLKARDCKNLLLKQINTDGEEFASLSYSNKELYFELGRSCRLEEIAVGWGFSLVSLEALKPAITMLRAITMGIGGTLGEDGLKLLPIICPLLESVILFFQVISDFVIINMVLSLTQLKVLSLCYCLGEISSLSFKSSMPNLRKLKLERVTPWMTNDDLIILTWNCLNLTELSLLGCTLLNSESQEIISKGWPGLVSIHLEECGEVTVNGITSLHDCKALEDLLLRHNGPGIRRNFILDVASKMPMLRKVSLDLCDAKDGDFDIPDVS